MARTKFQRRSSLGLKIVGWVCVAAGLLGVILPVIPGIPLLIAGLATLSTQHRWARVLMVQLKMRFRGFFRARARARG